MKQADLHVGHEYAFQTYKPYDAAPLAACVRIFAVDGGADLRVLRDRYAHLKQLLQGAVPQLDRLLFTLSGAY